MHHSVLLPREFIRSKRDGNKLTQADINSFVQGICDGRVSEAQMAAFAMAVFFRGLDLEEIAWLTHAMAQSGKVFDWSREKLSGPIVDKHSTGGVGDKVSLILAPLLAACGAYVPMITGRGLGHTGGTADKLESIPGYQIQPGFDKFRHVVKTVGCSLIGQTADLAPADKKLYACRDVTATVSSIPLITSSILSKKIAAGIKFLTMQVNFGNGAFMADYDQAVNLAKCLAATGAKAGATVHGLITDMNQPLGHTVGNSLEVQEVVDYFIHDVRELRLHELTMALSTEALFMSGLATSREQARAQLELNLRNGKAAECFAKMVAEMGGPYDFLQSSRRYLAKAPYELPVPALQSGYIHSIKTREVGLLLIKLGGGRRISTDTIDASVGFSRICHVGTPIERGHTLAIVHARNLDLAKHAVNRLQELILIGKEPITPSPITRELIV